MKILVNEGAYTIESVTDKPLEHIERSGRTCYQSGHKIGPGSAEKFVRMIRKRGHHTLFEHVTMTVRFENHSRGFTHELVRHRMAVFSQESTRYVDESDLHFVMPPDMRKLICGHDDIGYSDVEDIVKELESIYRLLLKCGIRREDARQFLPIGTTAEIVCTANWREWRHIFSLRCEKHAHWEIRRTMRMLLAECIERWPAAFDDLQHLLEG